MTKETLQYCIRGIIQYLDGDIDKFKQYVNKAMKLEKNLCKCGGKTIPCRYDRKRARLCTYCGRVWEGNKVIKKCLVNSKLAS